MQKQSNTLLISIAFLSFIVMGLSAGLSGVAWPSIRATFGLSLDAIGTLMLLSTVVSLLLSFNSGSLINKIGLGSLLMFSGIIGGMGFAGYAIAPAWWMVILFGIIASVGSTLINAGVNIYFATTISASLMNWLHACFGLGATLSPIMLTLLLNRGYSWRWGYGFIALTYAVLAVGFGRTLKHWSGSESTLETNSDAPPQMRSRDTLRLPSVWLSIALFFTFTGMESSAGQWPYTLFTEARAIAPSVAGFWTGFYWASITLGRVFFGIVGNRVKTHSLIRACMGTTICGAALIWWPIPEWWAISEWHQLRQALSFLGLALIGFSGSPLFPMLTSNTPTRLGTAHASNAIGFQITAVRLGLSVVPTLGGILAEAFGLEILGPFLFTLAIVMFLLYEFTTGQ